MWFEGSFKQLWARDNIGLGALSGICSRRVEHSEQQALDESDLEDSWKDRTFEVASTKQKQMKQKFQCQAHAREQ